MISKKDYFFYEWLIVGKKITKEKFEQLTPPEMEALKAEYDEFTKIPKIKICPKCRFVFDTPDTHGKGCMCLPEGKTCNDCTHYARCKMLGVIRQEPQTTCDWWPIRFVQVKQCRGGEG